MISPWPLQQELYERGMSRKGLSRATGLDLDTCKCVFRGFTVRESTAKKVADVLKIPLAELYEYETEHRMCPRRED